MTQGDVTYCDAGIYKKQQNNYIVQPIVLKDI